MPRYIEENEIYKLFNARGVAQLHVGDIDVLPRADVEPVVHARWIVPDDNYPDTCSNCLFEFVWDGDDGYHPKRCPNCGAKMKE